MTRKVRDRPYFDSPSARARWFTGSSAMREGDVTVASQAGMKRCISPYSRSGAAPRRGRPSGCSPGPGTRARWSGGSAGSRWPTAACAATGRPCAGGASRRRGRGRRRAIAPPSFGMSRGSFCMSPSIVTMTSPRAASMPACIAAVWRKLRSNRTMRTCGPSRAAWRSSAGPVPSRLPSSTTISSHGCA